jgi:hypothetical protein
MPAAPLPQLAGSPAQDVAFMGPSPYELDGGQSIAFQYLGTDNLWHVFANAYSYQGTEYWSVATDLVGNLATAQALQMVPYTSLSSGNSINETASSNANWVSASSPSYTTGALYVTFTPSSNNYYWAYGYGELAVTFHLQALRTGGHDLKGVVWYNPGNLNITLAYSGSVSWGAPSTATSYPGNCYTDTSALH